MAKNLFSTFQAAAVLGVTPDTVLKWIKAGKIPASRTLGGHYRVQRDTLTELIKERESQNLTVETIPPQKTFQHCWEFNSNDDTLRDGCRGCLVYRTRAKLCYEMNSVPKQLGHLKLFCDSDCQDCDYYKYAKAQSASVLIITDDKECLSNLENGRTYLSYKTTNCEYECSAIVEKMRPDIAVIDWSFPRAREFYDHLTDDSRIPYLKIIVVSDKTIPLEDNNKIIGCISGPLTLQAIEKFVHRL